MRSELLKLLRPIRNRLTRQQAMPRVAWALIVGGWLALIGALLTLLGGSVTSGIIAICVAVGFPLVALAWALLHPASWQQAAQWVDRRLHLHDRTTTALHLADEAASDPFAAMQVDDAIARLRDSSLSKIQFALPWQRLLSGLALTAFALVLVVWAIVAPPTESIQTSGDMQDFRQEVVDRGPAEIPSTDPETVTRSLQQSTIVTTSGQSSSLRRRKQANDEEISGAYFDRLQSAASTDAQR